MDPFFKKIFIILGLIILGAVLFVIGSQSNDSRGVGTGNEYTPLDGPAIMNDSEDLYRTLNDDQRFTTLREDLAFFGRNTIDTYNSGETVDIIFEVVSEIVISESAIVFEGKFRESDDLIKVTLNDNNTSTYRTEIINLKNNSNINSQLPSNNPYNVFISSLPYITEDYKIEYNSSTDSYVVTGLSQQANIKQTAVDYIEENSGIRKEEIKVLYIPYLY